MKRSALLFSALLVGAASAANAQGLSMQMSNGWNFSFAGNVNIFAQYQSLSKSNNATGSTSEFLINGGDTKGLYYGTGLLPAFATFAATGKEGNTDLGAHFGFAPEVQCGSNSHDCFGAQIDMRQVFLTAGGSWGTITAGKELGVYQRANILNDQTLFGVGGPNNLSGSLAPGGTTLGRIGYGYIYPNFVPQFTYSSPAGRSTSFNIGLMEPSRFGTYTELTTPRLEADVTFKASSITFNVSGTVQNGKDPVADDSKTAVGGAAVIGYKASQFSLTGSGYFGKGLGTTLMFGGISGGASVIGGELTTSYGYIGQLTYTAGKATLAGSYGSSFLKDDAKTFKTENSLISGGVYYQATKSLKVVGEGDYAWSKDKEASGKNKSFTAAFGLMLFY
ncbi:MAG: hypothetical protein ABI587_00010 [Gemmatimonadales bacterium]